MNFQAMKKVNEDHLIIAWLLGWGQGMGGGVWGGEGENGLRGNWKDLEVSRLAEWVNKEERKKSSM